MCGIAGAFDLTGRRFFDEDRIGAMTRALAHRGPDDEQMHLEPGLALGSRRLAIIDVAGGRQPMTNEDGSIWVAYEGELYNYPELRPQLLARGHTLKTHCDTEAWVHLYEDYGESVFEQALGQFAVALWDRKQRILLLGRDRPGIAPLFYAEADGWLLWASEIKALLASGLIEPRPDRETIDFFFNFFALPTTRSCFANVRSVAPGHFLKIRTGSLERRRYWDLDFPDAGQERRFEREADAVDELEQALRLAMRRRFLSEKPVCSYLSGGLDSTTILGLATQEAGRPVPSFTIGLDGSGPRDERSQAAEAAGLLGSPLHTLSLTSHDIASAYPELIQAAEAPVLDTSAACMIRLAQTVRQRGFEVSLSGEGADELMAGYVWFKVDGLLRRLGPLYRGARWFMYSVLAGGSEHGVRWAPTAGVRTYQQPPYEFMAQSREYVYSSEMWKALADRSAYDRLNLPADRFRRWHPLNQSLYLAFKVMLPGMLLAAKGDRAMHNASTEGRFPFLDEGVVSFCSAIEPRLKLRGLTDKWLLRRLAAKILPKPIANRPKTMFRAHLSSTFLTPDRPEWVDQLLSPESLRTTGYFDAAAVQRARELQGSKLKISFQRFVLDMGLSGVIATQLWHHIYCGGGLADLPTWSPPSWRRQESRAQVLRLPMASV